MPVTKEDIRAFFDQHVEIPPIESNKYTRYGFENLEKHNDMHVIPQCGSRKQLENARRSAHFYAKKNGFHIITRSYDCALFIWRVDYGREDEVIYLNKSWTQI